MEWKSEHKVMIIMIALFLGCIFLPVGIPRFDTAIIEIIPDQTKILEHFGF
jgi:hypothetical protein